MNSANSEGLLKAQTQTITIIIIAGIGISLVGVAYSWGMPMIQKRTTLNDYTSVLSFIQNLDSKITGIANSMAGQEEISIPKGILTVIPYDAVHPDDPAQLHPDRNSIVLEYIASQPMMVDGSIYLETDDIGEVALYGEAKPRIITLSAQSMGTGKYKYKFKLHYRELDTQVSPKKGYLIRLSAITATGDSRVRVSFDQTGDNPEVISGGAHNTGDLIATYVNILAE